MLSSDQCTRLLDKLCVRLGFCLPPVHLYRRVRDLVREAFVAAEEAALREALHLGGRPREGIDPAEGYDRGLHDSDAL